MAEPMPNSQVGTRLLFLQGPLGPFFKILADEFRRSGYRTYKINFNAGDAFFYSDGVAYTQSISLWSDYLRNYLTRHKIADVFLYGDCRQYHRVARKVCDSVDVRVWCFEEGYLRPDFITMEPKGVNANSRWRYSPATLSESWQAPSERIIIGKNFRQRMSYASLYYINKSIFSHNYPQYSHYRLGSIVHETCAWCKSGYRKILYAITEYKIAKKIVSTWKKNFFLVPLQVHNDSQILFHSSYGSITQFIEEVITSFAENSYKTDALVIKHHPMDRGFIDYKEVIQRIAEQHSVKDRVLYCHDANLPQLLRHTKGVVTINSTVGISALHHNSSVKVMGRALYDLPGITYQKSLAEFFTSPSRPSKEMVSHFLQSLYDDTQLNGNFYKHQGKTSVNIVKRLSGSTNSFN